MKVRKDFGKTTESIFYEFGPFHLDVGERRLRRGAKPVPLTPKVFDILLALIQNAGRLLTKDELMMMVWPDTVVEESNLARNISTLRRALGEEREQRQYIETIPWQGYRFVADVKESREESGSIRSLAVLPLANESEDPAAEYLSDGITESLIRKLSLLSDLKVMSRYSVFRCKTRDAETVGRELGVRAVLTGRIRMFDDVVIVSVELVDAADNRHLWGAQYNRQLCDLATMQEAISKEIAGQLRLKLSGRDRQRLTERQTANPEAYTLYLKGRYFWNKLTLDAVQKGLQFFEQAIEEDPAYALAYAGLHDSYAYLNRPVEARNAAAKALELDSTLGEAHASLGFSKFIYDRDFSGAETEFKEGIESNPNYAEAHHWYAIYLAHMGRHDEAIAEATRARELDPLSPLMNQTAGNVLMLARDYDGAVDALLYTLELDPHFAAAHSVLGFVYGLKGMFEEAVAQFEKAGSLAGGNPMVDANIKAAIAWVYARWGKRSEALKMLEEVSHPPTATPYSIAAIYAGLGETGPAFEWLETAHHARSFELVSLNVDPRLEVLRSDPKFRDLAHGLGLTSASLR